MKKPIFERIKEEAQNEADLLTKETEAEATRILKSGKDALSAQNKAELGEAEEKSENRVAQYKERSEKGLDTYKEQVRQEIVVSLFNDVTLKLAALEGEDLLNFVAHLIAKESVNGDEVMLVSKRNFNKFVSALSSKKDGNNLDLLNAKNAKFNFTLSKEPTHISEGFLLSTKEYDLIFDFSEIVINYQKKHEQRIYNELFKDE